MQTKLSVNSNGFLRDVTVTVTVNNSLLGICALAAAIRLAKRPDANTGPNAGTEPRAGIH